MCRDLSMAEGSRLAPCGRGPAIRLPLRGRPRPFWFPERGGRALRPDLKASRLWTRDARHTVDIGQLAAESEIQYGE